MEEDALLAERLQNEENAMGGMEPDYARQAIERQRALNASRGLGQQFSFSNR
jgi:hypothetical protein